MSLFNGNGSLVYAEVDTGLNNKKLLAIGDSFIKGDGVQSSKCFISLIGAMYNMSVSNCGINGASLAYSANEQYTSIMETYEDDIANNPEMDVVIVLVGHNDSNAAIHGGAAIPIGSDNDNVNTTFKGALNILINALLNAYPTAKILFLSPFKRTGNESAYAEAMEEITGKYSVAYYDNYKRSTICFTNAAQNSAYGVGTTKHLNVAGHARYSQIVTAKLCEL